MKRGSLDVVTFENITAIAVSGGGVVRVLDDGVMECEGNEEVTMTKAASKLTIELGSSSSTNTSVIMNTSGTVVNTFGRHGVITQTFNNAASRGCSNVAFGNIIGAVGDSSVVYVNGKRVTPKDKKKKKNDAPKKTYKLKPRTCCVCSIELQGSATLHPLPQALLDSKRLTVQLKGSGDVFIATEDDGDATELDMLTINLMGSGDVHGGCTKRAHITLMGSGDVRGVHIKDGGFINLMGSGDVRATADHADRVTQNAMGSGNISVRSAKKHKKG